MSSNKILIVVDMQNDFITGSLGSEEAKKIVHNVDRKVHEYISNGDQVIFTKDTHENNYLQTFEGEYLPVEHCIKDTKGWEICNELEVYLGEEGCKVLCKPTFGFTSWKDEIGTLHDNDKIEVCGLCTDICVISNVLILRAIYPNITIVVDGSCCAGVTPEKHVAALEVMRSCQIDVI